MLQATLTVNEAAEFLKRQPRTIREWIARGRLPARKVGGFYVIQESEIRKMITPITPAEEKREYDPERAARLAELRKVLSGLRVSDVAAYQAKERSAMKRSLEKPEER